MPQDYYSSQTGAGSPPRNVPMVHPEAAVSGATPADRVQWSGAGKRPGTRHWGVQTE